MSADRPRPWKLLFFRPRSESPPSDPMHFVDFPEACLFVVRAVTADLEATLTYHEYRVRIWREGSTSARLRLWPPTDAAMVLHTIARALREYYGDLPPDNQEMIPF